MSSGKPALIIIPGLGDRVRRYSQLLPLWKKLGYNARIFSFDWENPNEDFEKSSSKLLSEIDAHHNPIYLIGASAGGSVAVNALASRPEIVKKVITIAATFKHAPHPGNAKLAAPIDYLSSLNSTPPAGKILSIYGLYDQKVPPHLTTHLKASHRRIGIIGHGTIIAAAPVT